jgi:hypothetical protein
LVKISPPLFIKTTAKWFDFLSKIKLGKKDNENINYRVLHQEGHYVWHSSTIILIEKKQKHYIGIVQTLLSLKTNKTTTAKEVYEHIRLLLTDFAVFGPNHKYLYLL